ncbi:MAG: glutathione S-transferase family protein [Deltaproteobacteria bacterium]|nr:glutathione S-transferase family protein [Deltaproteobacteria bacterium]
MTGQSAPPRSIKLTYFDFHGGRGEAARIALSVAGIPFEDDRVVFATWAALKPTTPFGGLPMLEVDGRRLSQSNAINRYVGRLAGLYPEDAWEAARCDEIMDAVESLYGDMTPSFGMKGDAQKAERERLVAGPIPLYLRGLAGLLGDREWFVDGRLTMADLKVAETVRHLSSGRLDHIPTDLVENVAPTLAALRKRVVEHPGVRAYYTRFGL